MIPAWYAEVDPFCSAVLAHRWPDVPNLGDILAEDFIDRAAACGPIDILVGGTPCQSFSTAGKRGGITDKRGGLTIRFYEIAERLSPEWFVWENVPGVLSSAGGRDFGAVLGKVVQLGYGYCYRVLDSLGFGVPQRRRRVFLVGRSGARCPGEVLFEQEGEGRDPAEGRGQGEVPAAAAEAGPGGMKVLCHESGQGWWNQADHSGPIRAEGENRPSRPSHVVIEGQVLCHESGKGWWNEAGHAGPLKAAEGSRATCHVVVENEPIPIDLRQASRGGKVTNKRAEGSSGGPPGTGIGKPGDPAYTVSERGQAVAMPPVMAFRNNSTGDDGFGRDVAPAMTNGGGPIAVAIPVLAFDSKKDGCDAHEHAPTLRAMNHDTSWLNGGGQVGVVAWGISSDAVDRSGEGDGSAAERAGLGITEDFSPSLRARGNNSVAATFRKGSENPKAGLQYAEGISLPVTTVPDDLILHYKSVVRRLTPRECERLQGMPDDHTMVPWRGKDAPDSQRYRVVGNSMAVPVLRWIGSRLLAEANRG